jgi:methylenetetrahydrofolate reductase (NADPH)
MLSSTDATIQPQVKVIDILKRNQAGGVHVSFEFFPPKTEAGDDKLKEVLAQFATQQPVFVDFTWAAGGSSSEKTPELCLVAKRMGFVVNMHLTCTNMDEGKVDAALIFCLKHGIRNIVALRGDPPAGQEWKASSEGFTCALDLIKYIRKHYGDYFSLAVAGYPEGHPDKIKDGKITDEQMAGEIAYLKQKIDAGGDYIITQLFFDNAFFLRFVKACRAAGITAPILPGLLPPLNYGGFQRMTSLCKTFVPDSVKARAEELKEAGDDKFKDFGIEMTAAMIRELAANGINHFHFYTLNQTHSTIEVLKRLGMLKQ